MAMLNYQKTCAVLYESILYEYGPWSLYKYSELMIIPQEPVKENPTLDFWPYVATLQKV